MAAPTPPSLILHNLTTLLLRQFPDSSPGLVGPLSVTTYNFLTSSPPPTPAQIDSFVDQTIVPRLDPSLSDEAASAFSRKLTRFNPKASGSQLLHQTLSAQFDSPVADRLAADRTPEAAEHLASHATQPNLSPEKLQSFQTQAYKEAVESTLSPKDIRPGTDYDALRQATQAAMTETPQPPDNYWRSPPGETHPILRSFVDKGFSKFRYEATRVATEKFLTTEVGQKALAQATKVLGEKPVAAALTRLGVKTGEAAAKAAAGVTARTAASAAAAAGRAVTSAVAGAVGSVASAVGIVTLPLAIGQLIWTFRRQIYKGLKYIAYAAGVLASVVGSGIATTLATIIAAAVATPVIIALTLFIINAGAYVVPPSTLQFGYPPAPGQPPPLYNRSSCPLANPSLFRIPSYNPGAEAAGSPASTSGHGSNQYWSGIGQACTSYSLPQTTGCYSDDSSVNNCYALRPGNHCSFYGFALDLFPSVRAQQAPVFLPIINGQTLSWTGRFAFSNGSAGYTYAYRDTTNTYLVQFTHINNNALTTGNLTSGQSVATLYPQGTNTHLHVEMQVNFSGVWTYVRPEDYLCGTL